VNKVLSGGFLNGKRTYIISTVGILSALGSYLVGDTNIFGAMQAIFTLGGIYFLRKSNENKRKRHGKNSRKVSE